MDIRTKGEMNRGWRVFGAMLAACLLTGCWFLFVYKTVPFIYDINDDVAMRNVAAGVITGSPDAHLLHIKYLLGLVISGLYQCFPGLDWYGLTMIGVVLLSFALCLYRGLVSEKGIFWKIVYAATALLLMTALGTQHVSAFQWTTAAGIAGAAGIFLFYTAGEGPDWQIRMEEAIAVFLVLVSLLIRDDVFFITVPAAALCFLWKYAAKGQWKCGKVTFPFRLKHLFVPAALAVGVLVILAVEAFAYRSPEWRTFRKYNTDREAIMDYYGLQNYETDPTIYDELGISPEEAENLQRYSLYLADNLYPEKMAALARHEKEAYTASHPLKERLSTAFTEIYEHFTKDTYHPANLIAITVIALGLALCAARSRRSLGLGLSFLVLWFGYWGYLGYRDRLLERVGFVLYFMAIFLFLGIWYRIQVLGEKDDGAERQTDSVGNICPGSIILTFGIFCVLTLTAANTWRSVQSYNTGRRDYNLEFLDVNRYMAEHPENVYFMTTFSIETYTDNFTVKRDFTFSNLLSVGGWHTFSPLENAKCAKLGITDPKKDIVTKDNVYVISLENINLRYMDRYFENIYGGQYRGRELADTLNYGEQNFEVYDFTAEE